MIDAVPRPIATILSELIEVAQDFLCHPYRTSVSAERFERLRVEISDAVKRPAEVQRAIHVEAVMLCQVLDHIAHERTFRDHERARRWEMIGGCLLPMVRDNLGLALEQSRRTITP